MDTAMQALHLQAYRYLQCGKPAAAAAVLQVLVDAHPEREDLRVGLAYAHLQLGQPEGALEALAALGAPRQAAAWYLRGKALALRGQADAAQQSLDRYRRALHDEPEPSDPKGMA